MNRDTTRAPWRRSWRVYSRRDGHLIERQLRAGAFARCPGCGEVLEGRPETRLARRLVLDATGYDLDCRDCRRFWVVVRHGPRSLRLIRMRRLVAAVRAVELTPEPATQVALAAAG